MSRPRGDTSLDERRATIRIIGEGVQQPELEARARYDDSFPTKFHEIVAAARPVIVGPTARIVRESGAGYYAGPADPADLAGAGAMMSTLAEKTRACTQLVPGR